MSVARRSLQVVAFICTLVVGVASMAVIVTQTTWFKEWLRGFIVRQADDYVNGRLSIGSLEGNLFFGTELNDVEITTNGETVVDVDQVALDYSVFTLLRDGIVLDEIQLTRPVFRLERGPEGWNLARLINVRTPDPDDARGGPPVRIDELEIQNGTLYIEEGAVGTGGVNPPARVEGLDASLGITSTAGRLTVDVEHLSLTTEQPSLRLQAMSGVVRRTRDDLVFEDVVVRTGESELRVEGRVSNLESGTPVLDLRASSERLALGELARLLPALRGYELQPAFELTASGPIDRLAVDLTAREAAVGQIEGDLTVDARAPERRVSGTVQVENLNVQALTRDGATAPPSRLASDITGTARINLVLPSGERPLSGTYAVEAEQVRIAGYEARNVMADGRLDGRTIRLSASADAYGGHATASGVVQARTPLALDLQGTARNVDLRNLPEEVNIPQVTSDLQFAYDLTARGDRVSADVTFEPSTVAGASIASGTVGSLTFGDGAPRYSARGEVSGLDVQRIGQEFDIEAIATDRFSSNVSGTFEVTGTGGGRSPLTLDVTGTLIDSELFGATFPRMNVTTRLEGGDLYARTEGSFVGLNPAAATGNERLRGELTGTVDAETTLQSYADGVTVESLDVTGRVELEDSTLRGVRIDRAVVEGQYADRVAQIEQLEVSGPTLDATARGTLALNETGASNLSVQAEASDLQRLGEIIGRPLKGAAVIDATVTGNAEALRAEGTLQGSNIGYAEYDALTLDTTFDAVVPDLDLADARVDAKAAATFVEIGDRQINEVTADVTYADSMLTFSATGQQGTRDLAVAGDLVLHPDHQEIHLSDLTLQTEGITWRTAPGSESAIQWAGDRIEVQDVQLVSGDQRLYADGVIGAPGEALRVRVENLDVAQLDRLLLDDQRLAGRLTANAVVSGTLEMPQVDAEFTLTDGAFRNFTFQSLAGEVEYANEQVALDVRLQQTPTNWITAEGHAPLTLFRPNPPDAAEHDAVGAGGEVDIRIASSEIDLGIVQGFTSYLTNVTGTMQANVQVTGTGFDPHLEGVIVVNNGAFAIPELGTSYTGLDTRIDLDPDVVRIEEFKILDNRGFPMTIGGTLAVHERAVGAVNIRVQSENFEFIDNELADLKLDTELRITGELRRPRIEGFVEVENGTIHVAEVVDRTTSDPYALTATGPRLEDVEGTLPPALAGPPEDEEPEIVGEAVELGLLDAIELDIALGIPSNLVLRGEDIRPADAPIDIGDMSITVGGAVQIIKPPRGDVRLLGEVNTIRGTYTFQGRRFDIMRDGRIRFAGLEDINPSIDLRARRVIQGVETFVRVQGTLEQPELVFSSNPPLDQADILSLIVFNQPINQLGEGQQASLVERAGALAGGYLASGLARSIGNALELDEFDIQAGGERGFGPSLTIGEQVGEKFFFRIRQGFGDAQATELILEYQITDFLRLQGTAAETAGGTQRVTFRRIERAGIDLFFFFSY